MMRQSQTEKRLQTVSMLWEQAREQLEEYAQHLPDVDFARLKRVRVLFVGLCVERIEVL